MDKKILNLLSEIYSFLKFNYWLTPLNLREEKEKFLNSKSYNPQFIYPALPLIELQNYINKLKKINIEGNTIEDSIYHKKIKYLILRLELLLNRGKDKYTDISKNIFQCDFSKIKEAEKDIKLKATFQAHDNLSALETALKINQYLLDNYGITDWKTEVSPRTDFYVKVLANQKTILISETTNWDFCDFDNTCAHEIDGHVLRAINMTKQTNKLFQQPLPFYIKTEEGLASFLGDFFSTTSEVSLKHHAVKYLAGKIAVTSSFRQVYEFFCSHGFTQNLAYQRTFRLKRGLSKTQNGGLYAREAVYYEGMLEVKEYLEKDGDIKKLFAAKADIGDLDIIPIPKNLILPKRLKKYYDN